MNWKLTTTAAITALALVTPATADARGTLGVNRAGSVGIQSGELQLLHDRGLSYRVDFRREFTDVERDRVVQTAQAVGGVRILPILIEYNTPTASQMPRWFAYVRRMVLRYPQLRDWQIWNEPNCSVGGRGFYFPPQRWRRFVANTTSVIHRANPNARAVAGGIATLCKGWRRYITPAGDRTAIHLYPGSAQHAVELFNTARRLATDPIWVTEIGWSSHQIGQLEQARRLRYFMQRVHVPTWWYMLADDAAAPQWEGLGLIDRAGQAKPAWHVLSNAAR